MDCPKELTDRISARLAAETSLSAESIKELSAYLEGGAGRAPDWNAILKPAAPEIESTKP